MKNKVAIYARYSTDKQDRSSIDGQIKNCKAKAAELGYHDCRIFKDEAMSGTDLERPGFLALREALDCGDVEGVILDETSRLARNSYTLNQMAEHLSFHNQFIVDCKGYDSRNEMAEAFAGLSSAMDSMERKRIAARTYRGVRERADRGFSAGGIAYGFKKPDPDQPRKWHKHQKDPETAKVVVDIFKMYTVGMSPRAIASELNARGIPSPAAKWKRDVGAGKPTDGKWRASGINVMLENEIYHGLYIWNRRKYKKKPGTNKRVYEWRPEGEWKKNKLPFKIVDDLLWTKVQKRRAEVRERSKNIRAALKKRTGGSKCGNGRKFKYLLSGILKCESCGSNFTMRDTRRYKCASQCNGAESACDNTLTTIRVETEQQILGAVAQEILADKNIEKMIKAAMKQATSEHKNLGGTGNDTRQTQNRIATLEKQMGHLADAIAVSSFTDQLKQKHFDLEAELEQETAKLAVLTSGKVNLPKLEVDLRKGLRTLRENIKNLSATARSKHATERQIARLRAALHNFLGVVPLAPDYEAGRLIATIQPTQEALALLATGPSAKLLAYRSGSGGRI